MSPVVVTYLGFVVAILILSWGAFEVFRRYSGRRNKQTNSPALDALVPFKPTTVDTIRDPLYEAQDITEEDTPRALHTRAKQNGHFSESKKNS